VIAEQRPDEAVGPGRHRKARTCWSRQAGALFRRPSCRRADRARTCARCCGSPNLIATLLGTGAREAHARASPHVDR
jgi:hypothetical protein